MAMWKDRPARTAAPRRLALTNHPDGGRWVVHSVYLEKDTMDRDRSYFSHMLHLAEADPAAVLQSWDAPGWVTEYACGAAKVLPRGRLPGGDVINDEVLAAFLSLRELSGPTELASTVYPTRLRANTRARRKLVARFLHAFALARADQHDRDRLFVHAEPGLVALLLYAATRLLPPAWSAGLTFSTFEPSHRGLADYQLAMVVGTYLGEPGKGLDRDLISTRGYGLDTFVADCSSPELAGELPAGLLELTELAGAGEWGLVAEVHKLIGDGDDALSRVKKAVGLARGINRLTHGAPSVDDLLALRADTRAAAALASAADRLWPHLRAAALTDARVRGAYKDWLAEPARLDEFRREAAKALVKGDLAAWDSRWAVVRETASADEQKRQVQRVLKNLSDHLPALSFPARSRLRGVCAETGVWPDHALLAPNSLEELDALLGSNTQPGWQGYACFAVLGADEKNWLAPGTEPFRKAMRARARRFLFGAQPPALVAFATAARQFFNSDPALLVGLFQPYSPACRDLMDRLLRAEALEPQDWIRLIQAVNIYAGDWDGFLLEGDRLARLLVALGGERVGQEVWKGYLDELSPALLSPALAAPGADGRVVHNWERTVHTQLQLAAERLAAKGIKLVAALPPGGVNKLLAANDLVKWVEDPGLAEKLSGGGETVLACQAFGIAPLDLLRAAYLKGGYSRLELPRAAAAFAPLLALFRACYPIDSDFRRTSTAVTNWLALSRDCPDQTRAAFQTHLVCAFVPRDWHRDILEEPRQVPFLPGADARIREGLAVPSRRLPQPVATEDEVAFESTPRARRVRRRGRDAGGIRIIAFAVVLAVGSLIGAILLINALGASKPAPTTEPELPPAKGEKNQGKK
jgi:hypothetical protein